MSAFDTLSQAVKNKISSVASRLFDTTPAGQLYNNIQTSVPKMQAGIQNFAVQHPTITKGLMYAEPAYNSMQNTMRNIPSNPIQLPKFKFKNPIVNTVSNIPGSLVEGVLNAPVGIVKGAYQFPQSKTKLEAAGNAAQIMNGFMAISTPKAIPRMIKEVTRQPIFLSPIQRILEAAKSGAKSAGSIGGVMGTLGGMEQNKLENDPIEYLKKVGVQTAGGIVIGGALGGVMGGFGEGFQLTKEAIQSGAKNYADRFAQGLLDTKPNQRPIWARKMKTYKEIHEYLKRNYTQQGSIDLNEEIGLPGSQGRSQQSKSAKKDKSGRLLSQQAQQQGLPMATSSKKAKLKQPVLQQTGISDQPNLQTSRQASVQLSPQEQSQGLSSENLPSQSTSPDIITPKGKERGFTTSVQETPQVTGKVKKLVDSTYVPKTNKKLMGEAQALLQEGARLDLTKVENADQKVAATIQEAINQQKKNPKLAADLYNNLSESLTEMGKGIQAASLLDKMSPEAIALSAAGRIKKYNMTATRKIPELTGEQVSMIADKVKSITGLQVGTREHGIAVNELANTINNFIPSSLADKAITVWKAGLLTSLRTHERNLLGNSIMYGSEVIKDPFASVADMLMQAKTGKRTMSVTLQGAGVGAQRGAQAMKDVVTLGYDPEDAISKFDVHRITWGKNPVEQFLKRATDAVYRPLAGEDKIFWHSQYARSLYDQAGAEAMNAGKRGNQKFIENLVNNPTVEMATTALNDANYATFHDKSVLSAVAGGIKRAAKSIPGLGGEAGKVVTEVLAPFTGVPSSIVGKTLAYSPIGLVKGSINVGRVLVGQVPELQRQAAQEIGRGVVGTGLFGLGAYLMSKGLMTGQPKDAKESALWQAQNKPSNSVMWFDGKWKNIGSIGPQNLAILAGAKYQEEMGKPDGSLAAYGAGLAKDQLSQTFLQGVQQPIAAINDPARYGKSYLGNTASSIVPNIVKDASKAFDKNARETNTVGEYVKASIPGLRNTLLPKRDVLGNIVPQEPTGIAAFFDLFNSKNPIDSQVVSELTRLAQSGNEATPSKLTQNQTILKQKVKLTFDQLNNLEAGVGEVLRPQLQSLVTSPSYGQLDDEQKAKAIDKVVTAVRTQYKNLNANQVLSGPSATGFPQVNTTGASTQQPNNVTIVNEDGNVKIIDLNYQPITPTLTGLKELDKKAISTYNGEITQKINDIYDLYVAGKITADSANSQISDLKAKSIKAGAKVAKPTLRARAIKKVSMAKFAKPKKIKVPKLAKIKALKKNKVKQLKTRLINIKPLKV